MQTTEIVASLRACASIGWSGCSFCQREELAAEEVGCADALKLSAADRLEELLGRCARYAEEIAVLWGRQRWIPIAERRPEDPVKKCIVFVPHTHGDIVDLGRYLGSDGWVLEGWYLTQTAVTHWMPLPSAPEVE